MLRAKVLIFMIPLVLPIGQPPATATDQLAPLAADCPPLEAAAAGLPDAAFGCEPSPGAHP